MDQTKRQQKDWAFLLLFLHLTYLWEHIKCPPFNAPKVIEIALPKQYIVVERICSSFPIFKSYLKRSSCNLLGSRAGSAWARNWCIVSQSTPSITTSLNPAKSLTPFELCTVSSLFMYHRGFCP